MAPDDTSALAAAGPLNGEALRQRLDLHARGARDVLDALVALRLIDRRDDAEAGSGTAQVRQVPLYDGAVLDVLGPTIELLTRPEADDALPCVMRGTIPPGGIVPLHSHPDPETFVMLSGGVEGLTESEAGLGRVRIGSGDAFHVPGGVRHAWRNRTRQPAIMIVISTSRMGRFFQDVGTPVIPGRQPSGPPSADRIRHFLKTAERYGHWNATPDENARLGLSWRGRTPDPRLNAADDLGCCGQGAPYLGRRTATPAAEDTS